MVSVQNERRREGMDWIECDWLSTDFLRLDLTLFFIFANLSKKSCSQSSVRQHYLTSTSFFYNFFVYFLKQIFSAFPYFLSLLSVFLGLMFSDIICPLPFFYHSLSNHHKVKVLLLFTFFVCLYVFAVVRHNLTTSLLF